MELLFLDVVSQISQRNEQGKECLNKNCEAVAQIKEPTSQARSGLFVFTKEVQLTLLLQKQRWLREPLLHQPRRLQQQRRQLEPGVQLPIWQLRPLLVLCFQQ